MPCCCRWDFLSGRVLELPSERLPQSAGPTLARDRDGVHSVNDVPTLSLTVLSDCQVSRCLWWQVPSSSSEAVVTDQLHSTPTKERELGSAWTWRGEISNTRMLLFSLSRTRHPAPRGSSQTSSFAWKTWEKPFWIISFVLFCSSIYALLSGLTFWAKESPSVWSPTPVALPLSWQQSRVSSWWGAELCFSSVGPCSRDSTRPKFLFLPWWATRDGLLVWNTIWFGKTEHRTDWLKSLVF